LIGSIPRNEIRRQYAEADVFLLPSICEGSATAVYEALASGLPVICTANTGSVVRDGIDGFIVPIRDSEAIVEKLELLASVEVREQMSENAKTRASQYDLDGYQRRLLDALRDA
jgi:glycosyltransferase involved in cell wall biosynthesis